MAAYDLVRLPRLFAEANGSQAQQALARLENRSAGDDRSTQPIFSTACRAFQQPSEAS
jgi:hypothetical protein